MKIIRIEHEDGWGMFQTHKFIGQIRDYATYYKCPSVCKRHQQFPTPDKELLPISEEYFCAYKSVNQLQKWVKTEEIAILKENNYRILMLEVTDYYKGKHQVIYTKESIVNTTDITDLF